MQLKPFKPDLIGIDQDEFGIIPTKLIEALESCKAYTEEGGGKRMPKAIYLNPTGSNPTGVTMSLERRKEIYAICCKYNILILEDDAYYFLHFQEKEPVSFLSLDVEGRVIRFDSMSKVLSSGLRLAWLTGPKQLVNNIELHIQSDMLHSSTLSQVSAEQQKCPFVLCATIGGVILGKQGGNKWDLGETEYTQHLFISG